MLSVLKLFGVINVVSLGYQEKLQEIEIDMMQKT